jgi:hypothetical protein
MRWLRALVNAALTTLPLIDIVLGYQVYKHGWPNRVTLTDIGPGTASIKVTPIPFTATDFWILAALVGMHALLVYLAWRLRQRAQVAQDLTSTERGDP